MQFCFPKGLRKALTFSYDDGRAADRDLVELLNRFDLKATFHLNSGTLGQQGYVDPEEVAYLYRGHEVACHSVSHPHLARLPRSEALWEVFGDKGQLERLVGQPVRGFSYPYGEVSEDITQAVGLSGMEYARTTNSTGRFSWPEDFLHWNPTCHHNQLNETLVKRFLDAADHEMCPILYVWGHSYEFDRDENWYAFEELCSQLSGQEDVWYATNIQLKDYIQAIRSLAVTADGSLVYNPSAITVWAIDRQGQPIPLAPGVCSQV